MKLKLGELLVVMSLVTISNYMSGQLQAVFSSGDTYTQASSANDSFWNEDVLKIKHSVSGSSERVAWIKFSTLEFPAAHEQVILKLVKVNGDEGNVSLIGANSSFDASATWDNSPTDGLPFLVGGYRSGDTCFFDVTDYIQTQMNGGNPSEVAFKLFTTSIVTSPISFSSNESDVDNNRPRLMFYETEQIDLPLFNVFNPTTIVAKGDTYDALLLDKSAASAEINGTYGGWIGAKSEATGFFRTEKDCEGVWNIIDPDGLMFYSAGINSVVEGGAVSLPNDLVDMGLNTMGSWSDESISDFAYCPRFNVMVNFKNSSDDIKEVYDMDVIPVFDEDFTSFCQTLAEDELPQYVNDQWVLGYFLDNELLFHKNQLSISLTLSIDNAQYVEANLWMENKYGAGYAITEVTTEDEADYQGYVAETYFSIVSNAFRAVDPNHMLIGTRFHGGTKYVPQIFEAAGNYMDIITINYYSRFEPEEETMEMWLEYGDKPFIITEFYTKGEDSGLGNADGAGWNVATQQDRANWFENWMIKLLRNKGNVGFHWFRYNDKLDNDANKGLFTSDFDLYQPLAESFEKIASQKYALRSEILFGNSNYNGNVDCNQEICGSDLASCSVVLSSETIFEKKQTVLYPNPISDLSIIQFPTETSKVQLTNAMGDVSIYLIAERDLLRGVNSGYYQVNCLNVKDEVILTQRVLIL